MMTIIDERIRLIKINKILLRWIVNVKKKIIDLRVVILGRYMFSR